MGDNKKQDNNLKNTCHYVCSNMNYTNIIILIILIISVYHFLVKKIL